MKNLKTILLISLSLLLIASCGVAKSNNAKTKDIQGPGVIHLPVLADLNVKPTKVTGTATALLKPPTVTVISIKQEAIANALAKVNGDVLIEPFYRFQTIGKQHTVTVSGYPATYKNFRMMEEKDTTLYYVLYPKPVKETVNNSVSSKPNLTKFITPKGKAAFGQPKGAYEKFGKPGDRTPIQKRKTITLWSVAGILIIGLLSFVALNA